jgi:hypothetical protein
LEAAEEPSLRELSRIQRWGLSRNKVSLAEAGDGSPPFYFIIGGIEDLQSRRKVDDGIQDTADSRPAESGALNRFLQISRCSVYIADGDSLKIVAFLSPFGCQQNFPERGFFDGIGK